MKVEKEPGKTKWSVEDVDKLAALIATRVAPGGHEQADVSWSEIAKLMGNKTGKQCREKYRNDLRPGITKTAWCPEEDYVFALAHSQLGNKWHDVAQFLPQRAENTIKNRWNAVLRVWQRRTVKGYTLFENNLPSDFLSLYSTYAVHTPGPVAVERTKERWNELVELSEGQLPSLSSFEVPMDYFIDGPGATQLATLVQEDMAAAALRVPADLPLQSASIRAQLAAQITTDCSSESDKEKIRELARNCMQVSSPASGSRPRAALNDPSGAPSPRSGDRPVSPAPVVKQGRSKQSQTAANAPSFHAALESVLNNHLRGAQGQGQGPAAAPMAVFQDPFWDANTPPGPWESSLAFGTGVYLAEAATSGQTLSKKLSVDTQGRPASTSKGGARSQRPGPLNSPQVRIKTLPSPAGASGKDAGFSHERDEEMSDDDAGAPPVDQRPHSSKAKHGYDSDPDYTPGSETHRSKRKLTDATVEGDTAEYSKAASGNVRQHRDDPFRPAAVKRYRQDSVIKVEQEEEEEGRESRRQRVGVVGAEGDEPTPDDAAQLLMWLHENMPNKIKESPKDRKGKDGPPVTPARAQQRFRNMEQDSLVKGLETVSAHHSVDHTRPHSATHSSDDADTEQMAVPPGGHYAPPLSQQVESMTQQYSAWVTQQAKAVAAEGQRQWAQAHGLSERAVPAEQLQWPLPPQATQKQRGMAGGQPQWTGPVQLQPQQLLAPPGRPQRQAQPETPWEGVHGAQLSWGGKLPSLPTEPVDQVMQPAWAGPMPIRPEAHGSRAGPPAQWTAQAPPDGYSAQPPWAGQTPMAARPQVKAEVPAPPEGQWQWVASGPTQPEAQQAPHEEYTVQPQWAGPNQPPYAAPPQPMQPPPESHAGRKGQPQRAGRGPPQPAASVPQPQWAVQSQPPSEAYAAQQSRPGKFPSRQGDYGMPSRQSQWAGPKAGMASYGGQPSYAAPMQLEAHGGQAPQGHWAWEPQPSAGATQEGPSQEPPMQQYANMPPPQPMTNMPPSSALQQPHTMQPSTPQQQPQVVYVIPAMVNGVPQLPPGMWIPPANTNGSQQGWTMYMG